MGDHSETESDSSATGENDNMHVYERNVLDKYLFRAQDVRSAIVQVLELGIPFISRNPSTYQDSAEMVLNFLDHMPHLLASKDATAALFLLSEIGNVHSIEQILSHRQNLRVSLLQEQPRRVWTTVITWADMLLSRLAFAANVAAAGNASPQSSKLASPGWVTRKRDDDALQAACQIPGTWTELWFFLRSNNSSPAARRLAVSLGFLAYIISPKITRDIEWPDYRASNVMECLYLSIGHASLESVATTPHYSNAEKLHLAMQLSMFARANSVVQHTNVIHGSLSLLRPEGFGRMLDTVGIIIGLGSQDFDGPQSLLTLWSDFVPWTWSTWKDQRVAGAEYLRLLTSTWLYHCHLSPFPTEVHTSQLIDIFSVDLKFFFLRDKEAAAPIVSQLLCQILEEQHPESSVPLIDTNVLTKLCNVIVWYLEDCALQPRSPLINYLFTFGKALLTIFVRCSMDDYSCSLVLEGISLLPAEVLEIALAALIKDRKLRFVSGLDDLCGQSLNFSEGTVAIHRVKNLLEFLALVGVKSRDTLHETFLLAMSSMEEHMSLARTMGPGLLPLISPLLVTISQSLVRPNLADNCEAMVLLVISNGPTPHLSVPASLSAYIIVTKDFEALLCHECWNYLLGILGSIIDRQLSDSEEQLGLLVCGEICCALYTLLGESQPITRQRLLCSPITSSVANSLQKLLNSAPIKNTYEEHLCESLGNTGNALIAMINDVREDSSAIMKCQNVCLKLVYYREESYCGLIPAAYIV